MKIQTKAALLLPFVLLACFSFWGCKKKSDSFHMGILQWTENIDAFNLTCKGVVEGLNIRGFKKGENLEISYVNVEQDKSKALETAKRFVSERVDLILALGTGSSLAALKATEASKTPIIYSIVGAPKYAGIIDSYADSGRNISGITMKVPVKDQFEIVNAMLPKMKSIGILYCTENPQAVASSQEAAAAAPHFGWRVESIDFPKERLHRLNEMVTELSRKVEAVFIPTDPILTSPRHLDIISGITDRYQIPVISVVGNAVKNNRALLALHCDFYELGKQAASQIEQVFNGIDVQSIPSQIPVIRKLSLNLKKARELNIHPNRNVILQADNIYE